MYRKKIGLWDLRHWLQSVVADQLGQLDQLKKKTDGPWWKLTRFFGTHFFPGSFTIQICLWRGNNSFRFCWKNSMSFFFVGTHRLIIISCIKFFQIWEFRRAIMVAWSVPEILTSPRYDSRSKVHTIDFWCPWIYDVPTWHDAGPLSKNHLQVVVFYGWNVPLSKIFEHVEDVESWSMITDTVQKDRFIWREF